MRPHLYCGGERALCLLTSDVCVSVYVDCYVGAFLPFSVILHFPSAFSSFFGFPPSFASSHLFVFYSVMVVLQLLLLVRGFSLRGHLPPPPL
jgi:hypothetical protein